MNTESCHCGLLSCKEVNTRDKDNKFTLQPLPYAENSLEPYISEKTVKFHYGKHLAAYIDNTNKLELNSTISRSMRSSRKRPAVYSIMQLRFLIIIFISKPCTIPEHRLPEAN